MRARWRGYTPPGPEKKNESGHALASGYEGRESVMMIIPSFSESSRPGPFTQGAASSPMVGDSRPLFCFFSFFALVLTDMGADESISKVGFLLEKQPI